MVEKKPKKTKNGKNVVKDKNFTETIKIMANTQPISNETIIKRDKKLKK